MAALRRTLPPHPHPTPVEAHPILRALAADYPGALRELDSLPTDEIDRRVAELEGTAEPSWAAPMSDYHDLLKLGIAIRMLGLDAAVAGSPVVGLDEVALARLSHPKRRLLSVVMSLLVHRHGSSVEALRQQILPPRPGS